jgi:PAS domain S-box-containing protein
MSKNGNPGVVEDLLQRLGETVSALRASEVNGWDATTDIMSSMPSLLRQTQAELGRLQAEVEKLREAQAEGERNILQVIMENTRAHLAYLDPEFDFVAVNSTYVQGCGYSREELIGHNHFALFPNAANEATFERVRDTGEPVEFHAKPFEYPERPELGITYWDWTLTPVKNRDGEVEGLVLSLFDVTEQIRAQAEIESLSRFPSENPNPVLRVGADGSILYANGGSRPLLAEWDVQVGEKLPDEWQRLVTGAVNTGVGQVSEAPCDGRTFLLTIVPVTQKGYANLYGLEVTEQKRAQQALQHYADRLRVLHEADQAILAAQSAEEIADDTLLHLRQLVPCRLASVELFDLEAEEASILAVRAEGEIQLEEGLRTLLVWHRPIQELQEGRPFIVEDIQALPSNPLVEVLRGQGIRSVASTPLIVKGELIGCLNLGREQPGELTPDELTVVRDLATQLAIGIQQARLYEHLEQHADELEREVRKRTRALRASEARFRAIFEGAGIGIALVDRKGWIEEGNPALQELLGYSAEELRGKPFTDFSHPADVKADRASYEELMAQKGGVGRYRLERRYVRRDGRLCWASVTASLVQERGGKRQFAIIMMEDITERKRAQEALIQSEKLAVTGRLAASLAHEINNPLQSVIGSLELVEESLADGKDAGQFLQLATRELERVASIVGQLRDLNRPSKPEERALTDVTALVDHVLALTRSQYRKHGVEVEWKAADDLSLLMLVPDRIQQVFLNLVLNAVEAMPDGGRLEVRASFTDEPAGVRLSFADSGRGIATDAASHLFEPFYSTKPDGLGLGLYVTHNIVEEHGGHIEVESREGEGATFTVWLPA